MNKRVKIFKFCRTKVTDLTNSPEFGCNVIQCGTDKYTLKDFKLQDGHDDSIPYSAIFCLNGKPICECVNDGWGGQTFMMPLDISCKVVMASIAKNLSRFKWSSHGMEFELTIDFVADTLACGMANFNK